jgi:hypothetical protein
MPAMTPEQFLKHNSKGRGARKYLRNWKEKEPYAIDTWLSCQSSILSLWRHGWLRVTPVENKETRTTTHEVWSDRLVCYELEQTLQEQNNRDRDTGERDTPPKLCPHCLMIEYVRMLVMTQQIDWLTPIFRFPASDPRKTVVLHAAGIFNFFASKSMTDEHRKQMVALPFDKGGPLYAGGKQGAWRQNQKAKLEYAMVIADNDHPEDGLQIAIESNLLGSKVQEVMADACKSLGPERGNPLLHPYAIRWENNPSEGIAFDKRFHALKMDRIVLRPAIELLIRGTTPPDLSELEERFNLRTHRAAMERYAVFALPFDDFFAPAFADEVKREAEIKAAAAAATGQRSQQAPEVGHTIAPQVPSVYATPIQPLVPAGGNASWPGSPNFAQGVATSPPAPPEVPMFGCDRCEKPMLATDAVCPHCGMVYEVEPAPPPPPPPKLPSRSQARAMIASPGMPPAAPPAYPTVSPEAAAAAARVGLPPPSAYVPLEPDADDDIPFLRNAAVYGVREAWWRS